MKPKTQRIRVKSDAADIYRSDAAGVDPEWVSRVVGILDEWSGREFSAAARWDCGNDEITMQAPASGAAPNYWSITDNVLDNWLLLNPLWVEVLA